jgi:hypothetical protein
MIKAVMATLVALLVTAPAIADSRDEHAHHNPIGSGMNYGVIWEHKLTRSGLPDEDTGWDWLREQGVKSIVTFLPLEEANINYGKHGFMTVLRIPLGYTALPTDRQTQRFLAFIQDPKNQPVHIHCAGGRDRTGMMAALARYAVDGWPLDKALAEARTYRDGESLDEIRQVWLKAWAAKHPPGDARVHLNRTGIPEGSIP